MRLLNSSIQDDSDIIEEITLDASSDQCSFELNFSLYDFPNKAALTEPLPLEEYIKVIFYAVVLLVGLVGNSGVILTVILNRFMRTTVNLYLVNLAVADLLICLFCMWVPLANSITKPIYSLGGVICRLNPFAQMTCLTASVLTLSAISCDRFVAIIFPLHARVTERRTGCLLSAIWVTAATVALPFLFFRKYHIYQWNDIAEPSCEETWPREERWDASMALCIRTYPLKQAYYTFVTIILFFAPVAIMVLAYTLIVARLWRSHAPGESSNIRLQHRSKKKVVKMVCVVLLGFIICWSPLQVTILYSEFWHSASHYGELPSWFDGFHYFSMFMAYFNSALNPLLYGGFNHNFRQGVCALLRCSQPFRRPQFSQKSRTTFMTDSPSSKRVHCSMKAIEMKDMHRSDSNNFT